MNKGPDDLAERFLRACAARGILVATAESCTGGLIIGRLTDIPGSSAVVDRGFVTYSNDAKREMIGVSAETLSRYGAVSQEVAREMADGAFASSNASIALSVTGIAGPGGGSADKPVGLVWFGVAMSGKETITERRVFEDHGRAFIRSRTVETALELGLAALET